MDKAELINFEDRKSKKIDKECKNLLKKVRYTKKTNLYIRMSRTETVMEFPEESLDWMITVAESNEDTILVDKLDKIKTFKDNFKKNRWFGYYQRVGEEKHYWSLEEIIRNVRNERLKKEGK